MCVCLEVCVGMYICGCDIVGSGDRAKFQNLGNTLFVFGKHIRATRLPLDLNELQYSRSNSLSQDVVDRIDQATVLSSPCSCHAVDVFEVTQRRGWP